MTQTARGLRAAAGSGRDLGAPADARQARKGQTDPQVRGRGRGVHGSPAGTSGRRWGTRPGLQVAAWRGVWVSLRPWGAPEPHVEGRGCRWQGASGR